MEFSAVQSFGKRISKIVTSLYFVDINHCVCHMFADKIMCQGYVLFIQRAMLSTQMADGFVTTTPIARK
jgi:hypothetical protein